MSTKLAGNLTLGASRQTGQLTGTSAQPPKVTYTELGTQLVTDHVILNHGQPQQLYGWGRELVAHAVVRKCVKWMMHFKSVEAQIPHGGGVWIFEKGDNSSVILVTTNEFKIMCSVSKSPHITS
ncbi:hypothetical protein TNCV_2484711 [Trichonephila clavipes]|uniref:Uncharacterized protein n=1 Tax=Trichonephila clavipes TaxID=2585209 RepID=A0A8X7BAT4_TRICX|nr:hypothetical protein TNCV_2484711 [Trichonephila clavipes]